MNFFSIRTNHQKTIRNIFDGVSPIKFDTLSWHKDDVAINDLVFVVVSGDDSKKDFEYINGLKAIYRVTSNPIKSSDGKHFSLRAETISILPDVLTKDDFYKFPSLKNAPNIGPETKNAPNQSFRLMDSDVGKNVIRATMKSLKDKIPSIVELNKIIENDFEIEELSIKDDIKKTKPVPAEPFSCKRFIKDATKSDLKFNDVLVARFIASLCAKPFVILTGLSGSGKTKLAQAFAYWIADNRLASSENRKFNVNEVIEATKVNYKVVASDSIAVTFLQEDTGTKATLPYELIYEWMQTIKDKEFDDSTSIKDIKRNVTTKYSQYLNSFDSHLKAAASHLFNKVRTVNNASQICMVPVGADWTNREPLLGFSNALEQGRYVKPDNSALELIIEAAKPENSNLPFFLILDEMNLSHVERYFADFLSAMESEEPITLHPDSDEWKNEDGIWKDGVPDKINLSKNLFIIGTVNIDETTYMFSPKVLDRANVIEFRISGSEIDEFLQNPVKPALEKLVGAGASMAAGLVQLSHEEISDFDNKDEINETLLKFFNELKKTGAEFGYRSASEIYRFAGILEKLTEEDGEGWTTDDIIDAAIMQKLLPKLHGSRKKLEPVLNTLANLCFSVNEGDKEKMQKDFEESPESIDVSEKVRFKISLEKILRMKKRVIQDGFTSFAEA